MRRRGGDEDRLLPLVNIVFLLLIFFMVAGQLTAADPFQITPPTSSSDGNMVADPPLVSIDATGSLALDAVEMDEASLIERLVEREVGELRIKADGQLAAAELVALVDRLKAAGIATIRLVTVLKREGS